MRREQQIKPQFSAQRGVVNHQLVVDQEDRQIRIADHGLADFITPGWIAIDDLIGKRTLFWIGQRMLQIPPLLVEKCLAVGDEQLQVAGVRLVDARVVNLVDDAVTEGEPQAGGGVIGSADAVLRTRSPARFHPRCAGGHAAVFWSGGREWIHGQHG